MSLLPHPEPSRAEMDALTIASQRALIRSLEARLLKAHRRIADLEEQLRRAGLRPAD